MIKRLLSEAERQVLKEKNKFRNRQPESLSNQEIKELVILIAKKLRLL